MKQTLNNSRRNKRINVELIYEFLVIQGGDRGGICVPVNIFTELVACRWNFCSPVTWVRLFEGISKRDWVKTVEKMHGNKRKG